MEEVRFRLAREARRTRTETVLTTWVSVVKPLVPELTTRVSVVMPMLVLMTWLSVVVPMVLVLTGLVVCQGKLVLSFQPRDDIFRFREPLGLGSNPRRLGRPMCWCGSSHPDRDNPQIKLNGGEPFPQFGNLGRDNPDSARIQSRRSDGIQRKKKKNQPLTRPKVGVDIAMNPPVWKLVILRVLSVICATTMGVVFPPPRLQPVIFR